MAGLSLALKYVKSKLNKNITVFPRDISVNCLSVKQIKETETIMNYLVIDQGTSSTKAFLFNASGQILHQNRIKCSVRKTKAISR